MRSLLLSMVLLAACSEAQVPPLPNLIPTPAELRLNDGVCRLDRPWRLKGDAKEILAITKLLGQELGGIRAQLGTGPGEALPIDLQLVVFDTLVPKGYYQLHVTTDRITVQAPSPEGIFLGTRTLVQLLEASREQASIPCLSIVDHPRFGWRGMHLDVCRHFFPVSFVKKYIDLLARYKMNSFHWHLTEDQGWRIEIKQYPKLTAIGSKRSGSQIGPYSRREYDTIPYGGFYTHEEIREVVAYAADRHINVVPEIEMPGHAMAALAAYPELSCTSGPFEVQKGWGVFEDVFCPKEETFTFLENVLEEVIGLFPSPYIHIGGDECPKERWKTCSHCQALMKREGLKDEHELQSYFIQRIEKFVNSKGRKIIGWDEILEGGLAPNAAVMSWRGTEGGVAAAKAGHDVVMSPGSHCYFDHYQGDPANEPLAIGGHTTVQKVYSYEPVPAELTMEEAKHILGAQGNVWTEYILTPEHVEYMAVPRMLALAEVLWTPKEKRDEAYFILRLEAEFPKLEEMKVNASKSLYQVSIRPTQGPMPGQIAVEMSSSTRSRLSMTQELPPYSAESAVLEVYTGPVLVDSDRELRGWLQREGLTGPASAIRLNFNKATARPITLSDQPNDRYAEGGAFTLVDGIKAGEKRVNTEWLGWRKGVTITVDLGSEKAIEEIGIGALNEPFSWIHPPKSVEVSISVDGAEYTWVGTVVAKTSNGRTAFNLEKHAQCRYVRLKVNHAGAIPNGLPGAGNPGWLFLDEVEVR